MPRILTPTGRGLWALTWSFVALMATALLELLVALASQSAGLLADAIHNFADAATAIPLGIAFWLTRRGATQRFPYGLGRLEDFAGLAIVIVILQRPCRRLRVRQPVAPTAAGPAALGGHACLGDRFSGQ